MERISGLWRAAVVACAVAVGVGSGCGKKDAELSQTEIDKIMIEKLRDSASDTIINTIVQGCADAISKGSFINSVLNRYRGIFYMEYEKDGVCKMAGNRFGDEDGIGYKAEFTEPDHHTQSIKLTAQTWTPVQVQGFVAGKDFNLIVDQEPWDDGKRRCVLTNGRALFAAAPEKVYASETPSVNDLCAAYIKKIGATQDKISNAPQD